MKKHIKTAALIMALALLLAGCGKTNNTNNTGTFDRSEGLDDNGYWKGITASEYVKLPDLSSIKIKQSEIDTHIKSFLDAYPDTKQVKDRAVKDGDTINIDFVGKIDGKEFEGGSTQGQGTDVTIGKDGFIDNMLERMVGHMPGETFDMNAKFPESYPKNPDLQNKDSVFTVTINYIVETTDTKWTNEFVNGKLSQEYGWTTTAEAEAGIKAALAEDALFDATEFIKDVPESLTQYQMNSMIAYYEQLAASYQMDLATLVEYMGYESLDSLKDSYKQSAEKTSKFYLIYQALAEGKNFKITNSDLKEYFKANSGSEDYSQYESAFGLPYIKAMVMYEKMSKTIADAAQIVK